MKKLGKMPGFTKLLNSITCYLYYYVVGIFDHTLQIPECIKYVKMGGWNDSQLSRFCSVSISRYVVKQGVILFPTACILLGKALESSPLRSVKFRLQREEEMMPAEVVKGWHIKRDRLAVIPTVI